MNFTRETDNFDLKIQNKRCLQIVQNPLNKRETDIFNNKLTINPQSPSISRIQKLKLVEEMQNSIEEKLRTFSPYHNGRKNPNFVPLHTKYVTIVGNREKFDPLFNYEYQSNLNNKKLEKEEEEEKEKEKNDKEEDKNFNGASEQEILNFQILKRRQKQNIRKTPNSYFTQFINKSGYSNSNSFAEKKPKHREKANNANKEMKNIKTINENMKEDLNDLKFSAEKNKDNNKNRIRDFMTLEVNDAKINNLRKQEEENKEAYFGRRTIRADEHVKNRRTYIEEFSAKNNQIQEAQINKLVKERQVLQALVSNKTTNLKNQNEKNKLILQNENEFTPLENFFTKDYYRERAYFKALNYENIRKSLKTYENSRKEVRDYYKMNDKLIKDYIYPENQ